MTAAEKLLAKICDFYLDSGDFNGLPVRVLAPKIDTSEIVAQLIRTGEVDIVRGDGHPNPYIKALHADPIDIQIEKIQKEGLAGCLYPTNKTLKKIGAGRSSSKRPFTRELFLGAPQLDFRVFDLRFLEWYRNDPRYYYEVDDIHGRIRQREGTKDKKGTLLSDSIEFIEFGFAFDEELNRGVAVFLRYLHDLPASQQRLLKSHQLKGSYRLHPDFYRTQIIGDFPERVSIYDAFLEEKHLINEMCTAIGKPKLFRTDNKSYKRPGGFAVLIRPTNKEFRDFCLLLDQLFSDDLNSTFFNSDLETTETVTKEDGTSVVQSIGTIKLLETWVRSQFRTKEPEVIDQLFRNLRKVRTARQKPAHKPADNDYDQKYLKEQRELMTAAFDAIRTIRMILENHPRARSVNVPEWIRSGKVWVI